MKRSFARGLVWMSLLGFCLLATPGWATTTVLLNANFNDKPLSTPIGTGGPSAGEPIFVHPSLVATVQAGLLPTPSLNIRHSTGTSFDSLVFEFPGQSVIRDGDLRIAFSIRAPSTLAEFGFKISEAGNSLHTFGTLDFTATGNIHAADTTGSSLYLKTYAASEILKIEYIYHLDARTYDLRINNVLLLGNRPHGVTAAGIGIGRIVFATNKTAGNQMQTWGIDDLFVTHTRTLLLQADFNDKQLNTPLGTGGAVVGEPTTLSPGLSAIVRAAPLTSPSLHLSQSTITAEKIAQFKLLGNAKVRRGELHVGFTVHTPSVFDTFRMRMRQPTGTAAFFGGIEFTPGGVIETLHGLNGNEGFFNYAPDTTYRFKLIYQLAAGTYDIYINDKVRLGGAKHSVTDPERGVGALDFGLTGNTTQEWVVDELHVEHRPLLLDADFNQQSLDQQITTGGAAAGQPISVHANLIAEPRTGLFPTPALTLQQPSTGVAKSATFELLRNTEVKSGELRIGLRVLPPASNDNFSVYVSEQGSTTANFGNIVYLGNGNIRLFDSTGNLDFASYVPGVAQQFEFRYRFDAGKYDIYVDRVRKVFNRTIPSGRGIGRIMIGTAVGTTGLWAVDDLHVYQLNDTIFENGFD